MKIGLIPSVKEYYRGSYEFSVDKNLILFLKKCFLDPHIEILTDKKVEITSCDLIVFSGGNDLIKFKNIARNKIRDELDNFYLNICLKKNIRVLGICHGAQFISNFFESRIVKRKHIGRHDIDFKFNDNSIKINVNSYHNYVITSLGIKLFELARCSNPTI